MPNEESVGLLNPDSKVSSCERQHKKRAFDDEGVAVISNFKGVAIK